MSQQERLISGCQINFWDENQRFLFYVCCYRFSESVVEVNVARKICKGSDSGKNDHEVRVASRDVSDEKVDDCLPFKLSKDVSSHNVSITERSLNGLPFYNSKSQAGLQKNPKDLNTAK